MKSEGKKEVEKPWNRLRQISLAVPKTRSIRDQRHRFSL